MAEKKETKKKTSTSKKASKKQEEEILENVTPGSQVIKIKVRNIVHDLKLRKSVGSRQVYENDNRSLILHLDTKNLK